MFKKEINFISDLNLNKLQSLGNRFTIDDIKNCKIHPAIFQYINAAIDKELFSDRKKIEIDSICDYNSDRIINYFSLISEEIKRIQRFDFYFIKQILQNAVIFNINYLTQPNSALTKLIFSDSEVKSIEEIIIGLSHTYYYRFLQKILLTYLDKKKVLLMSRDEFISLLHRVDSISKETHLEETIVTAVNSMANFFDTNLKTSERLPIQAIKLYLDEKELPEFISRLENKFSSEASALFLTHDVINELNSVTPEAEIIIQETAKVEDDLFIDDDENVSVEQIESNTEIYEGASKTEKLSEVHNESIITEKIFDVDTDDVEIPNHQILSSGESIAQCDDEISEITEPVKEIEIEKSEIIEEANTEDEDNKGYENQQDEELNNHFEEDSKKKNSATKILKELIDINSIYESLLPPPKPFDTSSEKLNSADLISNLSNETNYQLDLSTIKAELEIKRNMCLEDDRDANLSIGGSQENISENDNVEEEYYFNDNKFVENPEEITSETDLVENNDFDINVAIDDIVNEDLIENEFLKENNSLETLDVDFDEEQELENLIEDSNLILNDEDGEEITEVFTDLAYLDQDEISPNNVENEVVDHSSEVIIKQEHYDSEVDKSSFEQSENYEDFAVMLASRNMTKIIESVFDYDMEDYHSIIEQISKATCENDAFQFTDEYCNNNHIEISASEVVLFKSLISEYFSRAYT
jgi:hypothetical protein